MKNLLIVGLMSIMGLTAFTQDNTEMNTSEQVNMQGRLVWTCAMDFAGYSRGFQIIIGSYRTAASGNLHCVSDRGEHFDRRIRIVMPGHIISASVGIGHFRFRGTAAEVSLVNRHPRVLFGHYLAGQGEVGVLLGGGAFTAAKVGDPQLALNISTQLLEGTGIQLGFHELTIEPLN